MESKLRGILTESSRLMVENETVSELMSHYKGNEEIYPSLKNLKYYNNQKIKLCQSLQKTIDSAPRSTAPIMALGKKKKDYSGVEFEKMIELAIASMLPKSSSFLKTEQDILEQECPYDTEIDHDATLKLVQIPLVEKERVDSEEEDSTIACEPMSTSMGNQSDPATPKNSRPIDRHISTAAKTGHQPNIDLGSPIGGLPTAKEMNWEISESEDEEKSSEDTVRQSLTNLTVQKLKIKLSDHGISAKGLKKAAMIDKLVRAENTAKIASQKKAPPPRARPKPSQHSRLMKSASDSNICTPPRANKKRNNQHLTPRTNEKKKVSIEKEPAAGGGRVGRAKKKQPPVVKNNRPRADRSASNNRSSSRTRQPLTKSSSLFDIKPGSSSSMFDNTPVKGPKSLFDSMNPSTPKQAVDPEQKRLDFMKKEKEKLERQKQKKEQQEQDRLEKARIKEEKRLQVKARQEQKEKERIKLLEEKNENKAQVPKKLGGLKAQSAKLKQAEEAKRKQNLKRKIEQENQSTSSNTSQDLFKSYNSSTDSLKLYKKRLRELEEQRRQAAMAEQERLHLDQAVEATYTVANADATVEIGSRSSIVNQTYDVGGVPSTPLRNVNQIPSETYELTPHGSDKPPALSTAENYNIDDLSSGDDTDDDERPKKKIPSWASTASLSHTLQKQYKAKLSQEMIFQGCYAYASRTVSLEEIFKKLAKGDRARAARLARRETAAWHEMRTTREVMDRTLNLDESCFPVEEPRPIIHF